MVLLFPLMGGFARFMADKHTKKFWVDVRVIDLHSWNCSYENTTDT